MDRFDGRAHADDFGFIGIVSPDGSKVFVTGASTGRGGSFDTVTIAYRASSGRRIWIARYTIAFDTATGTTLWDDRYDGPTHGPDIGWWLTVAPDGARAFVVGESTGATGPATSLDYVTLAFQLK